MEKQTNFSGGLSNFEAYICDLSQNNCKQDIDNLEAIGKHGSGCIL